MVEPRLVIAIDGPSGAGKSTAGRALAERLGYVFLDTGAMYRALALKAIAEGITIDDEPAVVDLAERTRIELGLAGRKVMLDGRDVSGEIRTREVSTASSRLSVHPKVRTLLVARQRELGRDGGVVMDGRDIGTHVFPDADVKFYLDADPRHRAERRHEELSKAGLESSVDAIEREIRARDHADTTRADSPLTRAHDALHIDTTVLNQEQVLEAMLDMVRSRQTRSR